MTMGSWVTNAKFFVDPCYLHVCAMGVLHAAACSITLQIKGPLLNECVEMWFDVKVFVSQKFTMACSAGFFFFQQERGLQCRFPIEG